VSESELGPQKRKNMPAQTTRTPSLKIIIKFSPLLLKGLCMRVYRKIGVKIRMVTIAYARGRGCRNTMIAAYKSRQTMK